jgi:hypothetical protein
LALCALAFCTAASLHAQGAAPPAPDTTPIRGAGVPGYLQSFKRVAAPVVISDPLWRVLVAAAPTAATLDAVHALDTLERSCPATSRSAGAPPSYASDAVAIDGMYLVVIVLPRSTVSNGTCEARWNGAPTSIWRALSFGGPIAAGQPVPKSLRLLVDGVEVKPARAVARPAYELRDGAWTSIRSQLRYYYPMSAIAPGPRKSRRMVTLQLWDVGGGTSSLELLSTDVQRLRYQYGAWRLATSTGTGRNVVLEPRHRVPQDVRDALDLAAHGQADSAALRAAERLAVTREPGAGDYGDDVAAMLVAEGLYQHGDTSAALGTIADVRAGRRCLSAPAGASAPLLAATSGQLRGSCIPHYAVGTLALGVVPGGGHLFRGNPIVGALAVAGLSSIFVSAHATEASANDTYAKYQSSRSYSEAPVLFQQATSQRTAARSRAQLGVALWAADAVLAAIITTAKNHVVSNGRL